jgi:hypothetical protein
MVIRDFLPGRFQNKQAVLNCAQMLPHTNAHMNRLSRDFAGRREDSPESLRVI